MDEYKIFRTDLWWWVYRKRQIGKLCIIRYLSWKWEWVSNKWNAKTFYEREKAVSALLVMKKRDRKSDFTS